MKLNSTIRFFCVRIGPVLSTALMANIFCTTAGDLIVQDEYVEDLVDLNVLWVENDDGTLERKVNVLIVWYKIKVKMLARFLGTLNCYGC